MRLTLGTRMVLWIAQREREGLKTSHHDVYLYWVHQKGVTDKDVIDALNSDIFRFMVEP